MSDTEYQFLAWYTDFAHETAPVTFSRISEHNYANSRIGITTPFSYLYLHEIPSCSNFASRKLSPQTRVVSLKSESTCSNKLVNTSTIFRTARRNASVASIFVIEYVYLLTRFKTCASPSYPTRGSRPGGRSKRRRLILLLLPSWRSMMRNYFAEQLHLAKTAIVAIGISPKATTMSSPRLYHAHLPMRCV
jgi:hypothetical protein